MGVCYTSLFIASLLLISVCEFLQIPLEDDMVELSFSSDDKFKIAQVKISQGYLITIPQTTLDLYCSLTYSTAQRQGTIHLHFEYASTVSETWSESVYSLFPLCIFLVTLHLLLDLYVC